MTSLRSRSFGSRATRPSSKPGGRCCRWPMRKSFEVELQDGVLNLLFEEPDEARFVVSPNAPVRQIWVSAMAKSYKLSWAPELRAFALEAETLPQLLDRLARTHLQL